MAGNLWQSPSGESVPQIYRWALRLMQLMTQGRHLSGTTREPITFAGAVSMTTLPTSDPSIAGQLWNDGGTVKVSAG